MRGLGTKSFTSLVCLLLLIVVIFKNDLFQAERLRNMELLVPFCIGIFSAIMAGFFFSFWDFDRKSKNSLWITKKNNVGEFENPILQIGPWAVVINHHPQINPIEINPLIQKIIYFSIFIGIGLLTFNNRALFLMKSVTLSTISTHYCPDLNVKKNIKRENLGCELVYRAYELGYPTTLGTCKIDEEEKNKNNKICELRRLNEPFLHYGWRKIHKFKNHLKDYVSLQNRNRVKSEFNTQIKNAQNIISSKVFSLKSVPRSEHHIWINLPQPLNSQSDILLGHLKIDRCLQNYSKISRVLEKNSSPSQIIDHVLGDLLFSPRYETQVAYCREYTIHWNAKPSSCEELAINTTSFLKSEGVYKSIKEILNRYHAQNSLAHMRSDIKNNNVVNTFNIKPNEFISFHCIISDNTSKSFSSHSYNTLFNGYPFQIGTLNFPSIKNEQKVPVELYKNIAHLFAPSFQYSGQINFKHDKQEQVMGAHLFNKNNFLMTRLDLLRTTDIFYKNDWVQERDDLLEVYPYYLHIDRFINLFRKEYLKIRGRL